MKQFISLLLLSFVGLLSLTSSQAEILDPVSWSYETEKVSETKYKLIYKASIDPGWHLYSQNIKDGGPVPTSFKLDSIPELAKTGEVKEKGELESAYDPNFDMELKWYSDSVRFEQIVELASADVQEITGELEFMVCDDKRCLPPKIEQVTFSLRQQETESASSSQPGIVDPIEWSYDKKKLTDDTYKLTFTASLDQGWYIYSQQLPDGGPVPTTFTFDERKGVELIDSVTESSKHMEAGYDSIFGMELKKFAQKVVFTQKVKLNDPSTPVTGSIEFMTCDDRRCLPPKTIDFSFDEKGGQASVGPAPGQQKQERRTLTGIFIAGFLGGFIALLTPCVFPMIPLTVSFFTKSGHGKGKGVMNAGIYGISIMVIYVLLGFIVTKSLGSSALNAMASNIWFNLTFFVVFLLFAISFFGAFEITLPSSLANKADSASERGGKIGIFFMAFTLAVVSFSCTGPIIGTLLVQTAVGGSNLGPVIGMTGFSFALALPFTLFAAFPNWLQSMPKSGGWMNTVKVTLGFLELGLAMKFLSNVDLAYNWGFLKREIFIAIWIVIGIALGLYLLGLFRFPGDGPVKKFAWPRVVSALAVFAFVVYLVPGLKGAPLHLLSGFPPPTFYSIWEDDKHCPHDLDCFHDYKDGLAYAKKVNKPVMIDFTGWTCVNCRKMEENVWIDPEIKNMLDQDYVLISLYVDEKRQLPKPRQYVSECSGQKITTVGSKWSDFQRCRFENNSQPYYVLMAPSDEEVLVEPRGYTPNAEKYQQFLEKGLEKFRDGQNLSMK